MNPRIKDTLNNLYEAQNLGKYNTIAYVLIIIYKLIKHMLVIEQENKPKLKKQPKKAKKQYSAGFRNYSIPKNTTTHMNDDNNDIYSTLRSLNIGNLSQAYAAAHPVVRTYPQHNITQSVLRLSKNQTRNRSNLSQQKQQSYEQQNSRLKFQEVYNFNKEYQSQAEKKILLKQKQKTQIALKKIYKDYKNIYDTFQQSFTQFLFCKADDLSGSQCPLGIDELKIMFKGFILNANMKHQPPKIKHNIAIQQLQVIAKRNLFIFCFMHFIELKPNTNKPLLQQIQQKVKGSILNATQPILKQFYSKKHITIPYDFDCTKPKEPQLQKKVDQQPKYVYKANPIPNSQYEPPKQFQPRQKKVTSCVPFSFDEKKGDKKISFEDYYHWNTSFKARQVPRSTYQFNNPTQNEQVNRQYRLQRAKKLAETSSFPASMQYLEDFEAYKEHRNQKILQKNQRLYSTQPIKPIPNFDKLHAKNIVQLEQLKQQNRKNTKPVQFKLHQTTKKITINQPFSFQENKAKKDFKPILDKKVEIKSTKKHDQYAKSRNKIKDNKIEKEEKNKKDQKVKNQSHQPLKKILENRIKQQIADTQAQKRKENFEPYVPASIKLDLFDIYKAKPLLMESPQSKKGGPAPTVYSDTFKPII